MPTCAALKAAIMCVGVRVHALCARVCECLSVCVRMHVLQGGQRECGVLGGMIYSAVWVITHFKLNFLPVWLHPSVMPLTEWKAQLMFHV